MMTLVLFFLFLFFSGLFGAVVFRNETAVASRSQNFEEKGVGAVKMGGNEGCSSSSELSQVMLTHVNI